MDRPRHPGARPGPAVAAAVAGGARRRLRRALRPPRTLRPTRAGWIFFALTLGVGMAALNTGNNLLYLVLSFMLAFLVLSGVLSESALRGVSVRRRVAREVFAEQPAPVALEVSNRQRRVPAFALVVEDLAAREPRKPGKPRKPQKPQKPQTGPGLRALGAPVGRAFVLRVGPRSTETRTYGLVAPRRGTLALAGFRVSTRFPFGLFSKSMVLDAPDDVLVYPALEPVPPRPAAPSRRRDGEAARTDRGAGTEVSGLREYAPGDPHRRVHWRASLRRGELLVREADSPRNARVLVRLATRTRPGPGFEAAVRRAASEVVAFLEAGLRVALRTETRAFEPGEGPRQRAALLAFLARVEASPTPHAEPAEPTPPKGRTRRTARRERGTADAGASA